MGWVDEKLGTFPTALIIPGFKGKLSSALGEAEAGRALPLILIPWETPSLQTSTWELPMDGGTCRTSSMEPRGENRRRCPAKSCLGPNFVQDELQEGFSPRLQGGETAEETELCFSPTFTVQFYVGWRNLFPSNKDSIILALALFFDLVEETTTLHKNTDPLMASFSL